MFADMDVHRDAAAVVRERAVLANLPNADASECREGAIHEHQSHCFLKFAVRCLTDLFLRRGIEGF